MRSQRKEGDGQQHISVLFETNMKESIANDNLQMMRLLKITHT